MPLTTPNKPARKAGRHFPLVLLVLAVVVAVMVPVVLRDKSIPLVETVSLSEQVLAKARPLVQKQQYAVAIDLMEAYVASAPEDVEVRPLLAEAQMNDGRFDQAERTTDQLLLRAPLMARALWLKGLLAARRGADPWPFHSKAAGSPDATGEIWAAYGLELLGTGRTAEANEFLRRARSAGIEDARTLAPLGQIELTEGRPDAAERLLTQALATSGQNPRVWAMLAEAQAQSGKLPEALATLEKAIAQFPNQPNFQVRAAEIACQTGRFDLAQTLVDKAASVLGDSPEIHELRGTIQQAGSQTQPSSRASQ